MRALTLFSGVGGLDAAIERAFGCTVAAHCEADKHCQRVLARHWPGVPCHPDVRTLHGHRGEFDLICGGFPCTDLSVAGKQAGLEGERSGLWFEYLRLVREIMPAVVVIENVPPLYRDFDLRRQVEEPLRDLGYEVLWTLCKASDVGAPHRRERTFALAWRQGAVLPPPFTVDYAEFGSDAANNELVQLLAVQAAEWPTPTSADGGGGSHLIPNDATDTGRRSDGSKTSVTLAGVVHRQQLQWPTPSAASATGGQSSRGGDRKGELLLAGAAREAGESGLWGTPCGQNWKGTGPLGSKSHARYLARGYLEAQAMTEDAEAARLWNTPNTFDALDPKSQEALDHEYSHRQGRASPNNLRDQVAVTNGERLWGTPRAAEYHGTGPVGSKSHAHHLTKGCLDAQVLAEAGNLWPTPTTAEAGKIGNRPNHGQIGLSNHPDIVGTVDRPKFAKGQTDGTASSHALNAVWVETLTGLPQGYTEAQGEPMQVDFAPHWPMGRGPRQHAWEPPRTVAKGGCVDRRKRLKALGNIVVPQQAMLALSRLLAAAHDRRLSAMGKPQMVLL